MKKILLIVLMLIAGCDNSTEPTDCAGVTNGVASEDDCGVCAGGTTGVVANSSKDCAGVCGGSNTNCLAVGTYTMTTYVSYETSSCSGQGYNELANEDVSLTLSLYSDGSALYVVSHQGETDLDQGSWTQSGNIVTITLFGDNPVPFTLSGNTLTSQSSYEDDSGGGCSYIILTKQ